MFCLKSTMGIFYSIAVLGRGSEKQLQLDDFLLGS